MAETCSKSRGIVTITILSHLSLSTSDDLRAASFLFQYTMVRRRYIILLDSIQTSFQPHGPVCSFKRMATRTLKVWHVCYEKIRSKWVPI